VISQTSKYALSILGCLAENRGERLRSEDIARNTGIPANYLSKILNQLRKQGVVEAEKGWGGGFKLREDAAKRSISEVLQIFDGAGAEHPCPLHIYWEQIRGIYRRMLAETTIEKLARTGS
jgi:Rrf2 family nitric oxide-sensitive transcriptional repressor